MAKELPFFKWRPEKYITGDITLCSYEAQGIFANLCSYYWAKKCIINLANAKQRYNNNLSGFEELINNDIIKIDEDENLVIEFLDEQMNEFIELNKKRSEAGSKGGSKYSSWTDIERKMGEQLYVLLMYLKDEIFLKIGITDKSISRRYSVKPKYNIKTIYQFFSTESFNHENKLQDELNNFSYNPKIKFPGYLESYNINSIDIIDNYFIKLKCKPLTNHKQIISKLNLLREEKEKDKEYIYTKFYDIEIEKAKKENNELYLTFVEWLFKTNPIKRPLNKILKMEDQISLDIFNELKTDYSNKLIKDTILNLENYTKKSYKSFNITLRNWLNKNDAG